MPMPSAIERPIIRFMGRFQLIEPRQLWLALSNYSAGCPAIVTRPARAITARGFRLRPYSATAAVPWRTPPRV
jgi:hypothetical protein